LHFRFPTLLIRPIGLCTQAIQLGIVITFVILSILITYVNSYIIRVFYFCIFSNRLDLLEATCSIMMVVGSFIILFIGLFEYSTKLLFVSILA
jgi:hypothetical protein